MATISKNHLSGSTDGAPIAVPINTGTFATVHTGPTNTADFDEVWIWASNANGSVNETVTFRIGGTANANKIKAIVPPQETVLVVPGIPLQGNATPLVIDVGSTTANAVNVIGYVNQIVG